MGRQGPAQRATREPIQDPRAAGPANESQRSVCARAVGDRRATERGRLGERRALDEPRVRPGTEVRQAPEVAGSRDRVTG